MRLFLRFLPVLSALFVLGLSLQAQAGVTLDQRTGFQIVRENDRPTSERPNWINRQDCFDSSNDRVASVTEAEDIADNSTDTWIHIFAQVTDWQTNSDQLDVYVSKSTDCAKEIEEGITGTSRCAQVYSQSKWVAGAPLVVNPRDIILLDVINDFDSSLPAGGGEDICDKQEEQSVSIYILQRRGDGVVGSASWTLSGYDLRGPSAPDTLEALPGDENLFLEWNIEAESEDSDTNGFTYYCVATGTEAGAGGAGSTPGTAGGAGGESSEFENCPQSILSQGVIPDEDFLDYKCGSTNGKNTRSGQAKDVINGTVYAVAVAAKDDLGNSGPLSPISCAQPGEVTTFFESYKDSGGKGGKNGKGFCGFAQEPHQGLLLWGLGLVGLLMARRRRSHS